MITAEQVAGAINDPEFYHSNEFGFENTTNKGGGAFMNGRFKKNQRSLCANNLKFHWMVPNLECFGGKSKIQNHLVNF
jgi:threonine aldolase